LKINTEHSEFSKAKPQWQRCRDLAAGSDAVKAGPYLSKPEGMTGEAYRQYKERAQYFNATGRTVEALAGAVLYRAPRVEGIEGIEDHLKDLTMGDESLETVAGWLVSELLTVGRAGIYLDMSTEESALNRPYWVQCPAESIVNWRTGRVGADPSALVLVVLRAHETVAGTDPYHFKCQPMYRELALIDGVYRVRTWRVSDSANVRSVEEVPFEAGDWVTPTRSGDPLPFIPFTFVGPRGVTPAIEKPPLLDLADLNVGHYRNSADLEHGLFMTALPTPVVIGAKGEDALKIGSTVAWDLEMGGDAKMLEFSGAGIGAIDTEMKAKERRMAILGARMLESQQFAPERDTAFAVRMRHSGDSATLKTIADAASNALTRLLRWHKFWGGGKSAKMDLAVMVKLHDEFLSPRLSADEVRAGIEAVQAGLMAKETFFHNMKQGGWTRPGTSYEDERIA